VQEEKGQGVLASSREILLPLSYLPLVCAVLRNFIVHAFLGVARAEMEIKIFRIRFRNCMF